MRDIVLEHYVLVVSAFMGGNHEPDRVDAAVLDTCRHIVRKPVLVATIVAIVGAEQEGPHGVAENLVVEVSREDTDDPVPFSDDVVRGLNVKAVFHKIEDGVVYQCHIGTQVNLNRDA